MRKGFLGSLTALLAGTSLALAEPPATAEQAAVPAPNGTGQPAAAMFPQDAGAPFAERSPSPYWPNPLGKASCAPPACGLPPAPHGGAGGEKSNGGPVIWGSAEYLLWWVKDGPLGIPLVTTGDRATLGALGNPATNVLFGNSDIDYNAFSGGRFTLGFLFTPDCNLGLESSGFFLEKRPVHFAASSSGNGVPVLARPIVNALTGAETVGLVADPGVAAGNIGVSSFIGLYGWDVNVIGRLYRDGPLHVDLLSGFRFLHMDEQLDIAQNSNLLAGGTAGFAGNALLPPTTVAIFDDFRTRNEFYGGQLGGRVEYEGERLFVSALGKIGLGSVHEVISLGGATTRTGPATGRSTVPGGLLVLSSNSGRRAHDEFAVVPEIGINVGYKICQSLRAYVGYTFLYWSDVARPGDQISRTVNPTIVPASQTFRTPTGPAQPSFTFQRTDFWAQGVNFGLELRY